MKQGVFAAVVFLQLTFRFTEAQQVEWADKVVEFSSQKSDKVFSAQQVLGIPSKLPVPGHSTCAWMPDYSETRNAEYIKVSFKKPFAARQIVVPENFNPGHVQKIFIYDSLNRETLIYTKPKTSIVADAGRLFYVGVNSLTHKIYSVKVEFDKPDKFNPYQIDAVGLTASAQPIVLEIYEIEEMNKFNSENLGPSINTSYDEIYPIISPDGNRLYFDRKLHPQNTGDQKNDDIWFSDIRNNVWVDAKNVGAPLNNIAHNFLCSISPDGNIALLGNTYTGSGAGPGVSIAYQTDKGWDMPEPVRIKNYQNLSEYNEFSLAALHWFSTL